MSGYKYQNTKDEEYYRNRCWELELQLQRMDVRFNNVLNYSGNKNPDQDADIHLELERAQKLVMQKKNEADLWKQKYENQLTHMMQLKTNYELEIAQQSNEMQRIMRKIDDFDDTDKNAEIHELTNKLHRIRIDDDAEIQRLIRENDTLRHKLNQNELDRQKELESLRFKLEGFHTQNLENMRKTQQNQIQVIESEIDKLRSLLEIKNSEIETLLAQNIKIKSNYEAQISLLQAEQQNKNQGQLQRANEQIQVKDKQISEISREINEVKIMYENHVHNLENQIKNIEVNLESKIQHIIQLQKEKNDNNALHEKELNQLKRLNEEIRRNTLESESEKLHALQSEINLLRIQSQETQQLHKKEIQRYEQEVSLLQKSQKEVETQNTSYQYMKKVLEDDVQIQKNEIHKLKQQLNEISILNTGQDEELKRRLDYLTNSNILLEQKNQQYLIQVQELQSLNNYEHQSKNVTFSTLSEENENLKKRIFLIESQRNKEISDLRQKLQEQTNYQIESLKASFNTQINILTQDNSDLNIQVKKKEQQIQELLNKYDQITKGLELHSLGPNELASKNVYETYVRANAKQNQRKQ